MLRVRCVQVGLMTPSINCLTGGNMCFLIHLQIGTFIRSNELCLGLSKLSPIFR